MINNGRTSMMSSHLSKYASNNNTNNKKGTDDSSNKKSNTLFRKTYGKQRTFNTNTNIVSNLMLTKDTKETKDDTKNISDGNENENNNDNIKSKERDKSANDNKRKSKSPNNTQSKIHCQCIIF